MSLPANFQFSQTSLQDFKTCRRRFELRYIRRLAWPAVESEPVQQAEQRAQLGVDFHRLIHQHLLGLAEDTLTHTLETADATIQGWWRNYLDSRPVNLTGAQLYPELTLSTPLGGYRLLARFDLLAVQPDGAFLIIDWKTSLRKPSPHDLAQRIQTRVYPYVLTAAGAAFNHGQTIDPAAVQLMYWYAQAPQQPELFTYSLDLHHQAEQFLSERIDQIQRAAQAGNFPLVEDRRPCAYCVYRSYCGRGEQAGLLAKLTARVQAGMFDLAALDGDQPLEL